MRYNLSSKGFKIITGFETLKLEAYPDEAGNWTIGFGTTKINGWPVAAGMVINEPVAQALIYGNCVDILKFLQLHVEPILNQNQIDALCSFTYNVGVGGLLGSTLLSAINHKLVISEDLFLKWNKIKVDGVIKESPGLTTRRKLEYLLYIGKDN